VLGGEGREAMGMNHGVAASSTCWPSMLGGEGLAPTFPLRDLTSEAPALPPDLLPGGIVEELPGVIAQEPRCRRG